MVVNRKVTKARSPAGTWEDDARGLVLALVPLAHVETEPPRADKQVQRPLGYGRLVLCREVSTTEVVLRLESRMVRVAPFLWNYLSFLG